MWDKWGGGCENERRSCANEKRKSKTRNFPVARKQAIDDLARQGNASRTPVREGDPESDREISFILYVNNLRHPRSLISYMGGALRLFMFSPLSPHIPRDFLPRLGKPALPMALQEYM